MCSWKVAATTAGKLGIDDDVRAREMLGMGFWFEECGQGEIGTRKSAMTKEVQATKEGRIQGKCCARVGSDDEK